MPPPDLSEAAPDSHRSPMRTTLGKGREEAASVPPPRPPHHQAIEVHARSLGRTGPTKWSARGGGGRQRIDLPTCPPHGAPTPLPTSETSAALLPAARKSFSITDGSSFMVRSLAETARQRSLWMQRQLDACTGARRRRAARFHRARSARFWVRSCRGALRPWYFCLFGVGPLVRPALVRPSGRPVT